MPSISGNVTATLEARVSLRLVGGRAGDLEVEVVIDTGFDGSLVLPADLASCLNLPVVSHEIFSMIGGAQDSADVALAQIEWLGEVRRVDVILKDAFLLGIALLDGTRLFIDYANRTMRIDK